MIPLVILVLGLGAALTAYETSARVRTRADDYVRAIRGAHAAHRAADLHLSDATVASVVSAQHSQAAITVQHASQAAAQGASLQSSPPTHDLASAHSEASQIAADVGVDRAAAAMAANQEAAQNTAVAAKSAKTEIERIAVAQSAAKVLDREKMIATALSNLGVGQCGIRSYAGVTAPVKDLLLNKLHGEGMVVMGDNPWDIETHQYDVKLRAIWDPKVQSLKLIVTAGRGGYAGLVTCDQIWSRIDPIVKEVISR